MDDMSFQNYCIVCDHLIEAAQEPEQQQHPAAPAASQTTKNGGRKKAQGTIRVKNPDGSTTIRTANGVKTTRPPGPPVRRNGSNAHLAPKSPTLQPSSGETTPPRPIAVQPPRFVSNIYCSQKCQDMDKGSTGLTPEGLAHAILGINTTYSDAIFVPKSSPMSPPSPLLGSDTDTSSAASTSIAAVMLLPEASARPSSPAVMSASPQLLAASAPKIIDSFHLMRDGPDAAWKDLERQRRSSIAAGNCRVAPLEPIAHQLAMSRQRSHAGSSVGATPGGPRSPTGASSDSLASLWNNENDLAVHRTASSGGAMRAMTPMNPDAASAAGGLSSARRSMSSSSDGSGIAITMSSRGLQRSTHSQTSLGGGSLASPGPGTFAEVGSAPNQHDYLRRYANAFPARDACVSPSLKPVSAGILTPDSRSSSVAIANAPLGRSSGTIRARPRTASGTATWDAFGMAEVRERARRSSSVVGSQSDLAGSLLVNHEVPTTPDLDQHSSSSTSTWRGRGGSSGVDATPKQSLEVENGGWRIRYAPAGQRSRSRSATREPSTAPVPESPETRATSLARPIPVRAGPSPSSLASTARSRTPQSRGSALLSPRRNGTGSMTVLPDLAALRIGSPCAPIMSPEYASPTSRSIPRAGFDWEGSGSHHRTYALPPGVVSNPNKGLFYFKA